ncbi:helix-turn-helix domain-containing protein [Reinekea sp.]|uniref:helix-turn-helix domain-containing protein n=1 Tax=Reinekea sp. TaxID=1970455 RepID=UPI003988C361
MRAYRIYPGHLIRSFKRHFGFTPHAYLINYRIQYGQWELKRGKPIAETAVNVGFADQPLFSAHLQKIAGCHAKAIPTIITQSADRYRWRQVTVPVLGSVQPGQWVVECSDASRLQHKPSNSVTASKLSYRASQI